MFECPPFHYMLQVTEHCPKAAFTYMNLWKNRDKKNKAQVYKEDVRNEFLVSLAKFRHDLFLLMKEGLVSVDETPLSLTVEMVDFDVNFDKFGNPLEN